MPFTSWINVEVEPWKKESLRQVDIILSMQYLKYLFIYLIDFLLDNKI